MTSRFASLFKPRPKAEPEVMARIKGWALRALDGQDATFVVNEIVCADPACPGTETIILVMLPGEKTKAAKIAKAMGDVDEQDVVEAVRGLN